MIIGDYPAGDRSKISGALGYRVRRGAKGLCRVTAYSATAEHTVGPFGACLKESEAHILATQLAYGTNA